MPTEWLRGAVNFVADLFPAGHWLSYSYNVNGLLAVLLVSVICGAVGALVVGNRMSFFSDALAHCAFAGVALGVLIALSTQQPALDSALVPLVTVTFGIVVGVLIALVREKTGLASDTVIGVFFAGAIGFGGMLFDALPRTNLSPESFLFGSPITVLESDILALMALGVLLAWVLVKRYNHFVLASFNPSLARSRNVPLRWCNYLFIVLLALIVNLCLRAVGALLINAMLVVPAAAAANVSRNLRQMFWYSVGLSVVTGVGGLWLSNHVRMPVLRGNPIELRPAGTIVVLSVLAFFATAAYRAWAEGRAGGRRASLAGVGTPPENASIAAEPAPGRPA
jgi:zinc transport system permease protein